MQALQLLAEREIGLREIPDPPPPGEGEVTIRVRAVGLNHIDVWGWRGMAFARRELPIVVGVEAAGEVVEAGPGTAFHPGERVVMYGAQVCGTCRECRRGRENLCENVAGIMGFHIDGFARERVNMPARLCVRVPDAVSISDAACVPVAYATVEHMLFDNARLEPGETILVQAGGSGIGTIAIRIAKSIGCTVITTVGSDEKMEKARALGADHVINYRTDRFEGAARRITAKKGVDVVFEHTGADTWSGSLLSLRRGGRLVTCGATSGVAATMNLMQLFQQQYHIFGSFGAPLARLKDALDRIVAGVRPVIDSELPAERFADALGRMEGRRLFGKIVLTL